MRIELTTKLKLGDLWSRYKDLDLFNPTSTISASNLLINLAEKRIGSRLHTIYYTADTSIYKTMLKSAIKDIK